MVKSIEAWTVKALINFEEALELRIIANLPFLVLLVLRNDLVLLASDPLLEIVNIGGVMEEGELVFVGLLALEHVEVFAEFVALYEAVGHLDAFGLHGVFLAEVVVGDGVVVEVAHAPHCSLNIITTLEHNPPLIAYRT
jgi:hypothetical protein